MRRLLILNSHINFTSPTAQEREIDSVMPCTAGEQRSDAKSPSYARSILKSNNSMRYLKNY